MPDRSVLVIDRASYHLVQKTSDTKPPDGDTQGSAVDLAACQADPTGGFVRQGPELVAGRHRPPVGLSKAELKRLVTLNKPEPRYEVYDVLAHQNRDLRLLVLPTHHPPGAQPDRAAVGQVEDARCPPQHNLQAFRRRADPSEGVRPHRAARLGRM
mmetsp:Transcript_13609/g.41039  ORF Transcript_13609/g.41039 Transcript_13609/m.41039 type:complete len:156 (-) Transcript_13609:203-670(-)